MVSSLRCIYSLHSFSIVKFMLILASHEEECHAKYIVDLSGTFMIKYLVITSVSLRFSASAYALYTVCISSFSTGVSAMNPCRFFSADIY